MSVAAPARTYEPPLEDRPGLLLLGCWRMSQHPLAPGVRGCAFLCDGRIWIPLIIAERPGSGDVGRFLSALSPRCSVVAVTSSRLRSMLVRRGFVERTERDEWNDVDLDVWDAPAQ